MTEVLRIDQYSIVATSTRVDDRTRVLKQGETFAVFDRLGDVVPVGQGDPDGL
jgi:predicted subunit of tRNA(5-methylaminomethyl-2-thiouridylate) methyltransferase